MKLENILHEEYKKVEETAVMKLNCNNSHVTELYDLFLNWKKVLDNNSSEFRYVLTEKLIRKSTVTYTPEDITAFCLLLPSFEENKLFLQYPLGYFLSYLVTIHQEKTENEEEYLLVTKHFEKRIDRLGYENKAFLTIDGDVGNDFGERNEGYVFINGDAKDYCGRFMRDGEIRLRNAGSSLGNRMSFGNIICEGNSGLCTGEEMNDGAILIKGNAGDFLGDSMRNGTIHIQGNAGKNIGYHSSEGFIHIGGEYESFGESIGVRIFQKGKQIFPKPMSPEMQQMLRELDERNKINPEYLKYFSPRDQKPWSL